MFAMAIGTACLLTVLSVFNGFEEFIEGLYSDFYAPVEIKARNAPLFSNQLPWIQTLKEMPEVEKLSYYLEEKVLLRFGEQQSVVQLRGVDTGYLSMHHIQSHIRFGDLEWKEGALRSPACLGLGVANKLGVNESSHLPVSVFFFGSGNEGYSLAPYHENFLETQGIFVLQEDIDNRYVYMPLKAMQEYSLHDELLSGLEVSLKPGVDEEDFVQKLNSKNLMNGFVAKTRFEQNRTLYFILRSERWAVFAILSFMLLIASFNIMACLSMLVIEKERDIRILRALGLQPIQIRFLFLLTGMVLSLLGAVLGIAIAALLCYVQQHFGIIRLGDSGHFLIEAYPVKMRPLDFILIGCTILAIALLTSWIPAGKASRNSRSLKMA
ncbi:MAG TPA: FtsX-like permease family protein [Chitinophagaceae bacterium]|nr:FtsX-like permease family protein [Chitinophagaceae bacterium]